MATDADILRAQRLGHLCAKGGGRVTDCPYAVEARVERHRWVKAYTAAGGRSVLDQGLRGVFKKVRKWITTE